MNIALEKEVDKSLQCNLCSVSTLVWRLKQRNIAIWPGAWGLEPLIFLGTDKLLESSSVALKRLCDRISMPIQKKEGKFINIGVW